MKLIPLGGAEEVGATCTLLEIGGHKILVDAGIRIGHPDPLPDLARISDFGGIEAILVTHAHTDHTGALPVVHRSYPNIPIYATSGTQAIVSVLLNDALNLMKNRYEVDREIPMYNREIVDSMYTRFQPVQLGQTIKLFGGDLAVTFFPAGHILGAACLGIQAANGESAFISGDISVTPQLTVGGMLPPVSVDKRFRPQVVMVESTYGNRMHANRATEERRLVESVAEIVEGGGRVVIPAFAVGRAQEILLILANAITRKAVAPFPVWVDGMVRSVCGVYTQHPYDLANALRRQILARGNPFFGSGASVKESDFTAINTPEERTRLAESGTPGVIVASSGMLSGGPSAFYARYITREAKSAIYITGYQDEESPGRALLSLAEATKPEERVLKLDGESVQVICKVAKYSLSAHVDAGEVAGLIEQLDPQETVLVHGAGGAREALSDLLMQAKERRIHLPSAGDELIFAPRKAGKKRPTETISAEPNAEIRPTLPASAEELAAIREKILETLTKGRKGGSTPNHSLTIQEIARFWLQANDNASWEGELTAEEYAGLRTLLTQKESGFFPDPRRPFLYRMAKMVAKDSPKVAEVKKSDFPLEQNAALAIVDKLFPPSTGLYRKGAVTAERKLVLYFNFPEPAAKKYTAELEELKNKTGWAVELNPETHQGALSAAVRQIIPPEFSLTKTPGVYREAREVRILLEYSGVDTHPDLVPIAEAFKNETGYTLQISLPGVISPTPPPPEDNNRLEINATFAIIEQLFSEARVPLFRKSLKQEPNGKYIELSFITREFGERNQAIVAIAQQQTGWPIRINPEPNQQALRELTEKLVKEISQQLFVKSWSLHRDRQEIVIKLDGQADFDRTTLQTRFVELTGWSLKI